MPDEKVTSSTQSDMLMKTTKRGRPFLKDTLDLFATLVISLKLGPHKQFFRTYPNTFSTDEAVQNLASLKFSQSNREPDSKDPSRIVTTTTITTFSMSREMAMVMCQHFMDARLLQNAADSSSNIFKDRGVYSLSAKALHILERFITRNGVNSETLQQVFSTQPICMKLLHFERRGADDEIVITQPVVMTLFRRFVGSQPNYVTTNTTISPNDPYALHTLHTLRAKGIPLSDVPSIDKSQVNNPHRYCFNATAALEWICDFTTVVGREEAAELAAHFVRFGLIALVPDKRKANETIVIFTVRGPVPSGNTVIMQQGEFQCRTKAHYRITSEGMRVARWDKVSGAKMSHDSSSSSHGHHGHHPTPDRPSTEPDPNEKKLLKESNVELLKYILEEPGLRSSFHDFLKSNFCAENLTFWLEVREFKHKFNISSSAAALLDTNGAPTSAAAATQTQPRERRGVIDAQKHLENLVNTAFGIHQKYLAQASPNELNLAHHSRNMLAKYFASRQQNGVTKVDAGSLQTMVRLFEDIQRDTFRMMATDSVPKFITTPEFQIAKTEAGDVFDPTEEDAKLLSADVAQPSATSKGGKGEQGGESGSVYVTISQRAREVQQQQVHHQHS